MNLADVVNRISVATPKVTGYLLNLEHVRGGPKARFFMLFGFDPERPEELLDALLEHGIANTIEDIEPRDGVIMYSVEGAISSPDGRNPNVRTVWQVDDGSDVANFVTAVPLTKGRGRNR